MTVPGCYLGLNLQVTATVSGGDYFGSNVTTLHVNLVGLAGFLAVVQVFPYNYIAFAAIMVLATLIGWRVGLWRQRAQRRAAGPRRPPLGRTTTPGAPPPRATNSVQDAAPSAPATPPPEPASPAAP
ncbi:MAG: hypothetical protein L3J91_04850, partial [Thermoplasmata archaeon]|nr:hypothetical protein [Thermoplasmata archaeon]